MSFRACIVLFVIGMASLLEAADMDWDTEITKTNEVFFGDMDAQEINQILQENFVSDFVGITPSQVIEGNFAELEEAMRERQLSGSYVAGPPNIVHICGGTAVAWHTLLFKSEAQLGCVQRKGTFVALYENKNGKAKVKFIHLTV